MSDSPEPAAPAPAAAAKKSAIPTPVALAIIVLGIAALGWVVLQSGKTTAHIGSWNAEINGVGMQILFDRDGTGEVFWPDGNGNGKFQVKVLMSKVKCLPPAGVKLPLGEPGQAMTYAAKADGPKTAMTCAAGSFTLVPPQAPGTGTPTGPSGPTGPPM